MTVTPQLVLKARKRLLQMHFESGVGHIGGNLSCLDAMLLVNHEYLNDDDRFILSKGHSAGALYVTLWTLNQLTDEDLTTFHRDNTQLPGHPPVAGLKSVSFATGSLGHGLSLAVGTALAFRLKNQAGHVYCLTSDGEWQEGSTWEALIFAAHHRLNNLTIVVDHNQLQGFGSTAEVASMSPLADKIRGFDVSVQEVDGHDVAAMRETLNLPADRPRLIILNTIKGHGISFMENQMEWHYLPLSQNQFDAALSELSRV